MKKLFFLASLAFGFCGNAQSFQMVKDVNPSTNNINTTNTAFREVNGKVYYVFADSTPIGGLTNRGLYISDGTSAGTYRLTPTSVDIYNSESNLIVGGNKIYFMGSDTTNGCEPWVYDTVTQTASMIKNINPSNDPNFSQTLSIKFIAADANKAFFIGNDGTTGDELWVTDGTEAGTHLVKDIFQGENAAQIYTTRPADGTGMKDGKLYFFAVNGNGGTYTTNGAEPWVSDGTEAGTFMLKDIFPGSQGSNGNTYDLKHFIEFNGKMYFTAQTSTIAWGLYETDGTTAGTNQVVSTSFYAINEFFKRGNFLYFVRGDKTFWKTDGTTAGTTQVATFPSGLSGAGQSGMQLIEVGGTMYARTKLDNNIGTELYKYDDATNQLVLVKDIWSGSSNGIITNVYEDFRILQQYDNKIWFLARESASGAAQVYVSDGTEAGTVDLTTSLGGFAGGNGFHSYNLFASSFGVFVIYVNMGTTGSELYFYSNGNMGISDTSKAKISIYPNPVKDILNFSEEVSNIKITDVSGRTVKEISNSSKSVNLQNLTKGIYIISATTKAGKAINQKLIKE